LSKRNEYRSRRDIDHEILKYLSVANEATRVELFHYLETTYTTLLKYEASLYKDGLIEIRPPHKLVISRKGREYVAALDIAKAIRESNLRLEDKPE
jgi:predicted transcriptional regulator